MPLSRKPCRLCGGDKGPGARQRQVCDACVPLAKEEEARKSRERTKRHYATNPAYRAGLEAVCKARRLEHPELTQARTLTARLRARGTTIVDEMIVPLIVLERHDGVCGICQEDVDPLAFEVDHIIPLSRGGEHSYANTQPSHRSCNRSKGAHLQEEYA